MSETLRDLVVSLSLNSDNFTRNIKSINKQIQEAESAFRLASEGVANFETTTAGLSSKLSTLQRTFQLQQDAVGQYERALQQASDPCGQRYAIRPYHRCQGRFHLRLGSYRRKRLACRRGKWSRGLGFRKVCGTRVMHSSIILYRKRHDWGRSNPASFLV